MRVAVQPGWHSLSAVGGFGHADGAVTAIAEVVGHGRVGGGADVGRNIGAGAAVVAAHVDRGRSGIWVAIDVTGTGAVAAPHGTGVGAVVGGDVGAIAAAVPAHPPGLGGQSGNELDGGEGEFGQYLHNLAFFS